MKPESSINEINELKTCMAACLFLLTFVFFSSLVYLFILFVRLFVCLFVCPYFVRDFIKMRIILV